MENPLPGFLSFLFVYFSFSNTRHFLCPGITSHCSPAIHPSSSLPDCSPHFTYLSEWPLLPPGFNYPAGEGERDGSRKPQVHTPTPHLSPEINTHMSSWLLRILTYVKRRCSPCLSPEWTHSPPSPALLPDSMQDTPPHFIQARNLSDSLNSPI